MVDFFEELFCCFLRLYGYEGIEFIFNVYGFYIDFIDGVVCLFMVVIYYLYVNKELLFVGFYYIC